MNKIKIETYLKFARRSVSDIYTYDSVAYLKKFLYEIENQSIIDEYEKMDTTYNLLLKYFAQDSADPQREDIYKQLQRDILYIVDRIEEYYKGKETKDTSNIYYFYNRQIDLEAIVSNLLEDEKQIDLVFLRIVLTDKVESNIKSSIESIFESNKISTLNKTTLVSAVTLSLIRFFDENKFLILLKLYRNEELEISMRAIIGLIIAMSIHEKRLNFHPNIISQIKLLNEVPENAKTIELVILQLIKSLETKQIITEFQKEILPEMMKMQPDINRITFEESDDLSDEENPNWESMMDKNPEFFERVQNFSKRQFEGSDIFSATLGSLKQFSFFNQISNWFIPFSSENKELTDVLKIYLEPEIMEKFLNAFEKATYFCNSDKYSFSLYLQSVPPSLRNHTVDLLINEIDAAQEMIVSESQDNNLRTKRDIIVQYIQDIYRFYNFNHSITGFENLFDKEITPLNTHLIEYFDNKLSIIEKSAELLFEIEHYKEAIVVYSKAIQLNINKSQIYEKIGFCYQKESDLLKAIDYYKKAELFDQNKSWLYSKLAFCYFKTIQYENAMEYYKKLQELKPENINAQFQVGRCLMELRRFDEALKIMFKIDYYKPNDLSTMRYIEYCSFYLGKFEQAKKYAQKCIDIEPEATDFFIMGNIYWIEKNKAEAINYYLSALAEYDTYIDFSTLFREHEKMLLDNGITKFDIRLMFDYLYTKFPDNFSL